MNRFEQPSKRARLDIAEARGGQRTSESGQAHQPSGQGYAGPAIPSLRRAAGACHRQLHAHTLSKLCSDCFVLQMAGLFSNDLPKCSICDASRQQVNKADSSMCPLLLVTVCTCNGGIDGSTCPRSCFTTLAYAVRFSYPLPAQCCCQALSLGIAEV